MSKPPTTGLQRPAGNPATGRIQRLIGAVGSAQEGERAPFTLNEEFITKHVANDATEAEAVTEARIAAGSGEGIVAGSAANHLAKEDDWTRAIEDSPAKVPPEGEWEGMNGDDGQFVNQLARVEVAGWEAKGKTGELVVRPMINKKFVGGIWGVTGSEFDGDDAYVDGSGSVSMDIKHLTS